MKSSSKGSVQERAPNLTEWLADLLRDKRIGSRTVIAIADAIAVNARCNIWFYDNVKNNSDLPDDFVLAKLSELGDLNDQLKIAIRDFQKGSDLEELETSLKKFSDDTAAAMTIKG